ncbi:hypothetical protein [Micromonospora sp. ALFpr18c]|uniref:hypothetical protein n=1 Tax=unclassified Micromonospora TaxID=2617518 RepID=UPI001788B25B|nr:hypothetical protein [Micromonospora sp. ALFpr18c]
MRGDPERAAQPGLPVATVARCGFGQIDAEQRPYGGDLQGPAAVQQQRHHGDQRRDHQQGVHEGAGDLRVGEQLGEDHREQPVRQRQHPA